jgi:hypothetical protein
MSTLIHEADHSTTSTTEGTRDSLALPKPASRAVRVGLDGTVAVVTIGRSGVSTLGEYASLTGSSVSRVVGEAVGAELKEFARELPDLERRGERDARGRRRRQATRGVGRPRGKPERVDVSATQVTIHFTEAQTSFLWRYARAAGRRPGIVLGDALARIVEAVSDEVARVRAAIRETDRALEFLAALEESRSVRTAEDPPVGTRAEVPARALPDWASLLDTVSAVRASVPAPHAVPSGLDSGAFAGAARVGRPDLADGESLEEVETDSTDLFDLDVDEDRPIDLPESRQADVEVALAEIVRLARHKSARPARTRSWLGVAAVLALLVAGFSVVRLVPAEVQESAPAAHDAEHAALAEETLFEPRAAYAVSEALVSPESVAQVRIGDDSRATVLVERGRAATVVLPWPVEQVEVVGSECFTATFSSDSVRVEAEPAAPPGARARLTAFGSNRRTARFLAEVETRP